MHAKYCVTPIGRTRTRTRTFDTAEPVRGGRDLWLLYGGLAEDVHDALDLVHNLLEPQLVHLVDRDEE